MCHLFCGQDRGLINRIRPVYLPLSSIIPPAGRRPHAMWLPLIQSNVFSCNKAYARRKLISRFIQSEGQYAILTILGAVLLLDARHNPATLEMMEEESAMSVLVNTIVTAQKHSFRLHRIFLELFYEMCQVQNSHLQTLLLSNQTL